MMDRLWTIFLILFMKIVVIFSATPSQLKEKPVIILYLSDLSTEDRSKETSLLWATEKVNKYENLPIKLGRYFSFLKTLLKSKLVQSESFFSIILF